MNKRILSVFMALCILLGCMSTVFASEPEAKEFSDMPENWATEALESAVANGLLRGADGKIMPDSPLTRAQMAAIIVRAFAAIDKSDISTYVDVRSSDWFADDIAKADKMGVMQGYGDGIMNPNGNITREQAFTVLARALKLAPASDIDVSFQDVDEISEWAKGPVYALVNAGYVQGSNGRLNPKAPSEETSLPS